MPELLGYEELIKQRQATHYLMLLAIASNVNSESPADLFNRLREEAGFEDDYLEAEMDVQGLEALKRQLNGNSVKMPD